MTFVAIIKYDQVEIGSAVSGESQKLNGFHVLSLGIGGKSKKLAEFKLQELPLLECMQNTNDNTSYLSSIRSIFFKHMVVFLYSAASGIAPEILGNQSEQIKDTGRCQKVQTLGSFQPL